MPKPIHTIRFPIAVDAGGGRLRQESDYEQYIAQLIRQVLLTSPGERINRPNFGAGLRRMVFAPNGLAAASLAETTVFQALNSWLGRLIRVDNVTASAVDSRLDVQVVYTLIARGEQRFLSVEVTL